MTKDQQINPWRVRGNLPSWIWKQLYRLQREPGIPVLVIENGSEPLVLLAMDDYNALIDQARGGDAS